MFILRAGLAVGWTHRERVEQKPEMHGARVADKMKELSSDGKNSH